MRKYLSFWFVLLVLIMTRGAHAVSPVACTLLSANVSTANQSTYVTDSVTPTANALIFLAFSNTRNIINDCANSDITSVTGNSLTWAIVNEQCYSEAGAPTQNIEIWRTMGASPSAGTISINVSGSTQSNAAWAIVECTGIDTSGSNGSGAIVQSAINTAIPGTSLTMNLAAFGHVNNATLYAVSTADNIAITQEGGYTELTEQQVSDGGLDQTLHVGFLAANDTTPSATFSSIDAGGVAVEIKSMAVASRRAAPLVFQ